MGPENIRRKMSISIHAIVKEKILASTDMKIPVKQQLNHLASLNLKVNHMTVKIHSNTKLNII